MLWLSFGLLLLTLPLPSSAQVPLKRDQVTPFALRLLADSENAAQEDGITTTFPVGVGVSKFAISLEDITFSGQDKGGHPWTVNLDNQHIGLGYKLYSGDLDRNGFVDAVLMTETGGSGRQPSAVLAILTFDLQGRPLLWQAGLNLTTAKTGIDQLVDLDRDGKAELITEHYAADGADEEDGYFVTDVYKVENGRWRRLNQYAGLTLPGYAHFSSKGEELWLIRPPEKLPPDRRAFAPDLSNVAPVVEGKPELGTLVKQNGNELELVRTEDKCVPDDFILVEDAKLKRSISILSGSDTVKVQALLTQPKIKLYGNCAPGKLSPRLIWITK